MGAPAMDRTETPFLRSQNKVCGKKKAKKRRETGKPDLGATRPQEIAHPKTEGPLWEGKVGKTDLAKRAWFTSLEPLRGIGGDHS